MEEHQINFNDYSLVRTFRKRLLASYREISFFFTAQNRALRNGILTTKVVINFSADLSERLSPTEPDDAPSLSVEPPKSKSKPKQIPKTTSKIRPPSRMTSSPRPKSSADPDQTRCLLCKQNVLRLLYLEVFVN